MMIAKTFIFFDVQNFLHCKNQGKSVVVLCAYRKKSQAVTQVQVQINWEKAEKCTEQYFFLCVPFRSVFLYLLFLTEKKLENDKGQKKRTVPQVEASGSTFLQFWWNAYLEP